MADAAHIPNHRAAIQTILKELDWAYEAHMVLVDLIGDVLADPARLNYPKLRKAAAKRMRESVERRDAALRVLDGVV